jgi:hypothetical protein
MAQKPSERQLWFLPLLGFLIPIGIGCIFLLFQSLQWSMIEKKTIVEQNPEKQSKSARTIEQKSPQARSSPVPPPAAPISAPPVSADSGSSGLLDSEISLYATEISHLKEIAQISLNGGKELQQMGSLTEAESQLKEASHKYKVASCLENQRKLGMPFYQGQATCVTAIPAP